MHTLVGAGGAAGTGDAANLLKPALARGTLRTIGATTWAEYKKYIEKDPALTRRFQTVKIEEPTEDKALLMMRGIVSAMEKHHRVQVLDEALEAAVKLVSSLHSGPPVAGQGREPARYLVRPRGREPSRDPRRGRGLSAPYRSAARPSGKSSDAERSIGIDVVAREGAVEEALTRENARLEELRGAWAREKELVDEILALRSKLREATGTADRPPASDASNAAPAPAPTMTEQEQREARERLKELQAKLADVQGERPLMLPSVDEQAVASVVADWTGIPVGRMVKDEISTVLSLADTLGQRVVGQDHALEMIARRVQTARASLENPNKPIGVFMLAGPSGVGKTETALALAEALYGGEQNLITINMSEFQEAHTVSTLKGAPPGYVGYGEGGVLTNAVRRRPYSVVLLDEVEKAHPDVHEIFFQVFDKGMMEDGEGRLIDFKNTLIILTTNVGTDLIMNLCKDPALMPDAAGIAKALRAPLLKTFPPALLGRIVTIPYYPLGDAVLSQIIRLQFDRIVARIRQNHAVDLAYDDTVVKLVAARCTEPESGGRMIDAILTNTVLPRISHEFLTRISNGLETRRVTITARDAEFGYEFA